MLYSNNYPLMLGEESIQTSSMASSCISLELFSTFRTDLSSINMLITIGMMTNMSTSWLTWCSIWNLASYKRDSWFIQSLMKWEKSSSLHLDRLMLDMKWTRRLDSRFVFLLLFALVDLNAPTTEEHGKYIELTNH